MARQVWKSGYMSGIKDEFIIIETIYSNKKSYLIVNRRGDFKTSHTHVSNFQTAKDMIYIVAKKLQPTSKSIHFITSLIRINKDKKYAITLNMYKDKLEKEQNK